MLLGVVSDTHSHQANTRAAVERLAGLEVQAVLHCGDIGSSELIPLFAPWPTHFVLGNVDHDEAALRAAILAAGQHDHGLFGSLELGGRRIAWLHGHDSRRLAQTIACEEWDLVCYGHTHQANVHRQGRTLVVNPGALFRARTHTVAVVDLAALEATIIAARPDLV